MEIDNIVADNYLVRARESKYSLLLSVKHVLEVEDVLEVEEAFKVFMYSKMYFTVSKLSKWRNYEWVKNKNSRMLGSSPSALMCTLIRI